MDLTSNFYTTVLTKSDGTQQILHVSHDSESAMNDLFNPSKYYSVPMRERKFPKSFFSQPNFPNKPSVYHTHSRSLGVLSMSSSAPSQSCLSYNSSFDSTNFNSHNNNNNNNNNDLSRMESHYPIKVQSSSQRRMKNNIRSCFYHRKKNLEVPKVCRHRLRGFPFVKRFCAWPNVQQLLTA